MPARGEHWYNVAILSYISPKARAMAQRSRIRVKLVYRGDSWQEARHALGLAVARASRLKLAYGVQVLRDYELFIMVNVEHI